MLCHRTDEPPRHHFRSDRCLVMNGAWYIATREGVDVGPYPTRAGAETAARNLIAMLRAVDDPARARADVQAFARRRAVAR
jgi:hypothetical protein